MPSSIQQRWLAPMLAFAAVFPCAHASKLSFRKIIKKEKTTVATPDHSANGGYDGPHADLLETALKTHQDYVGESAAKIAFPVHEMNDAVSYVLKKFGSVVAASSSSSSSAAAAAGDAHDQPGGHKKSEAEWSLTFGQRPPRSGSFSALMSWVPNGWGLFFVHRVRSNPPTRLDLARPSELSTFLRDFPLVAQEISEDAAVNALFAFLGGKDEPSSHPPASRSQSGRVLGKALKKRAKERAEEIDEQYAKMSKMLDEVADLATAATDGRIIINGFWRNAQHVRNDQDKWERVNAPKAKADDGSPLTEGERQDKMAALRRAERQRELDPGPKVAYFFPSLENGYVSGFRAHLLGETFNLTKAVDRYRFGALFPELFSQIGERVLDKYNQTKTAEQRFAEKIAQLEESETGQTMKMLGHPAFMVIWKSRLPAEVNSITLGEWTPAGKNGPARLELSTMGSADDLQPVLRVSQRQARMRLLTSELPRTEAELKAFEEDEADTGPIPVDLLREFVQAHNEKTKREALGTVEREDARNY